MKSKILFRILSVILISLTVHINAHSQLTVDKFVNVDGHKIHYQSGGTGNATVVFESGFGDNLKSWNSIYSEVASFAKVIRYDREGLGLSDAVELNSQPKNYKQIATRLHTLLSSLKVGPPYVLVGHSFGGAIIRAFTFLYPKEVSGLVFVDPQNEYNGSELTQEQRMRNREIASMDSIIKSNPAETTRRAEWEIAKSEYINGYPEIKSFGALPNVPIVLFVAGAGGLKGGLRKLYEEKMRDLSAAYFIEVAQSGHYVHNYEPQLVIENIRRVAFPKLDNK
jgi:pimeloyl-ACP methyl ester carboxylesterase